VSFNDNELGYLIKLLESEGDTRVPAHSVYSYLVTQSATAAQHGYTLLAVILMHASKFAFTYEFTAARNLLAEAKAYKLDEPFSG
jgi:hypothetical protein